MRYLAAGIVLAIAAVTVALLLWANYKPEDLRLAGAIVALVGGALILLGLILPGKKRDRKKPEGKE